MQQMERFKYADTLDIKMRYYTIMILVCSQHMTMIVTKFGNFKSNRISMGICAQGDILQDKVYDPISDIYSVKEYINHILVLSKESFSNHI